jgi:hypothetical protein
MATTVKISSAHRRSAAVMSIFESCGSRGNSAIFRPNRVSSPSSSRAPNAYNDCMAPTSVATGGGSMKSNLSRSWMPMALSCNTTFPRLVRWISGIEVGSISVLRAASVYKR